MPPNHNISAKEVVVFRLDGPPEYGFDCGRAEQTAFYYGRAWDGQFARLSVTYRYFVRGVMAAFATVCMDSLPLSRRERGPDIPFQEVAALKLAQLGVALPFQRMGIGKIVVADVIRMARREADYIGCRYVTLDAQRDLVDWYEHQGFGHNKLRQERREQDAVAHGRDATAVAVSMRYDLGPMSWGTAVPPPNDMG